MSTFQLSPGYAYSFSDVASAYKILSNPKEKKKIYTPDALLEAKQASEIMENINTVIEELKIVSSFFKSEVKAREALKAGTEAVKNSAISLMYIVRTHIPLSRLKPITKILVDTDFKRFSKKVVTRVEVN